VPESCGEWSALYRHMNLWSKKGVLMRIFRSLRYEPDLEWEFIDGIVKAHQHSTSARTEDDEGIGKSVAGNMVCKKQYVLWANQGIRQV
jgi:hypothetical protein